MKKFITIIIAVAMLMSTMAGAAMAASSEDPASSLDLPETNIIGFLSTVWQMNGEDSEQTTLNEWVSLTNNSPEQFDVIGPMPGDDSFELEEGNQVAAAQRVGDKVYGYLRNNVYFVLDWNSLADGFIDLDFYNPYANIATDCAFQYVAGMSYDYETDTMYVMVNGSNYIDGAMYASCIGTVDLETGDVINFTNMVPIHGELDGTFSQEMCAFTVANNSTAYCITDEGFGSDESRLCYLDVNTGEYIVVGPTGQHGAFEQCMAYDYENDTIYWAQSKSSGEGSLCVMDIDSGYANVIGLIGGLGGQITAMLFDSQSNPPETPTPTETPTQPIETETPEPPVTEAPIVTEDPTDTPEDPTDGPGETDAPGATDDPGTPGTDIPSTGAISLIGVGVAAVLAGSGVVILRKKEEQ